MGGDDKAYDRNKIARERAEQLDALRSADPEGYEHFVRIYDGLGHWMQKQDAEALPWLNGHRRNAWPRKVVWHQDDVVHERFYWLGREPGVACAGETIVAEVDGRTIRVTSNGAKGIVLWLSDELLSLDEEVIVELDGVRVHAGADPPRREGDAAVAGSALRPQARRDGAARAGPLVSARPTRADHWTTYSRASDSVELHGAGKPWSRPHHWQWTRAPGIERPGLGLPPRAPDAKAFMSRL
jgi:hypothetical protein